MRILLIFIGQLTVFFLLGGPLAAVLITKGWLNDNWFFDIPSFIIVFGSFLALGMGGGIRDFFRGYRKAGSGDALQWKRSLESVITFRRIVFAWSVLGFLIGAVLILSNLDDTVSMSRGFSCALLTIHYGLAFILVFCLPLELRLRLRLAEFGE